MKKPLTDSGKSSVGRVDIIRREVTVIRLAIERGQVERLRRREPELIIWRPVPDSFDGEDCACGDPDGDTIISSGGVICFGALQERIGCGCFDKADSGTDLSGNEVIML